jgi:NAD(P)-dependent dehydrogenase (short-subunit alcohol dehydrogenase family)
VLVTGGGRGLGRAYARLFAERGASVVVHDAGVDRDGRGGDASVAKAVAVEIGGTACTTDLSSRAGCEEAVAFTVERYGRLDALVHSAGLVAYKRIEETDADEWERLLAVNVSAPFWLACAAFPIMRRARYGRVVLTVSGVGLALEWAMDDVTAYAVGKAAQLGLMVALAREGAADGILVNAVSPAAATRMYRRETAPGELTPEQVAPGVVFLASEVCSATGVVLRAMGGTFSTVRVAPTEELDLGAAPSPEDVAAHWHAILG